MSSSDLICAECGTRTADDATRCPMCRSTRLRAPPDPFSRVWLRFAVYAVAGSVLVILTLIAFSLPVTMLSRSGIPLPGEQARRARSLEVQLDLIRDAERSLPAYPGATRVSEYHGTLPGGTARTLAVCWQTPEALSAVRRFYQSHLTHRDSGWRRLGSRVLAFRKGRIFVTLDPPEDANPPCPGTYQLFYSYSG